MVNNDNPLCESFWRWGRKLIWLGI
jgi:hypothetical protein